jgi:hypothetical protein
MVVIITAWSSVYLFLSFDSGMNWKDFHEIQYQNHATTATPYLYLIPLQQQCKNRECANFWHENDTNTTYASIRNFMYHNLVQNMQSVLMSHFYTMQTIC